MPSIVVSGCLQKCIANMTDYYFKRGLMNSSPKLFEELFHCYYETLCIYAKRYLSCDSYAEEIVQNCFLALWEQRKNVEKIKSFEAYLHEMVYNDCMKFFKSEKMKEKFKSEAEYKLVLISASKFKDTYNSKKRAFAEKMKNVTSFLLGKLKGKITAIHIEGYNVKEAGLLFGITLCVIYKYIHNFS